jgi:DNA polymerase III alpha subunit (gram-positive type)
MGKVVVQGKVFQYNEREIKGDRKVIAYWITDLTDSLIVKQFAAKDEPSVRTWTTG